MSTSSNSSNTGPNRFRGDAASFSPRHSSPGMIYQQVQQQQMYPQYMFGTPQMIPTQYYPYMAPYVINPNAPYSPYGQAYQTYPMQIPQFPGQPFPSVPAGAMNMNVNMNMNMNADMNMHMTGPRPKSNAHSGKSKNPTNMNEKSQNGTVHNTDNEKITQSPNNLVKNRAKDIDESQNVQPIEEGEGQQIQSPRSHEKDEKEPRVPMAYPVYFNVSAKVFKLVVSAQISERKAQREDENKLMDSLPIEMNNNEIIICRKEEIEIEDHDKSERYSSYENASYNFKNNDDSTLFPQTNKDGSAKDSQGSSNWASFLQSTAVPAMRKPRPQPKLNSVTSSPHAVSNAYHSTHMVPTNQLEGDTKEAPQPMGILILRLMFDEKLSIFASHDSTSVYHVKAKGLTNTGNICYMNAVLQVLLFCEPFNRVLKLVETKSIGSLNHKLSSPLVDMLLNFFNEFTSAIPKTISPDAFYTNLITHEKFSHLKWGQQEDAQEFLGYLLEGLHEEFTSSIKKLKIPQVDLLIQQYLQRNDDDNKKVNDFKLHIKNTMKLVKNADSNSQQSSEASSEEDGWSEVGPNNKQISARRTVEIEPTPITQIFGGQFRSVLQVPQSKDGQSITVDPFQCIQLDISDEGIDTIEDGFRHLSEPEQILYKSSNDKEVTARKQTFIDKLPQVLIIHLKRFSYQKDSRQENDDTSAMSNYGFKLLGSIEKLRKKIQYLHNLVIPPEALSPIIRKRGETNTAYKLIGVIYHHGASAEGGHYTCDVLRKSSVFDSEQESLGKETNNEWIRVDDTQLDTIDSADVLEEANHDSTKTAYILLYQKV